MLAATVALGVDVTAGTEAAMTVVTLTATASEPVNGVQSVDINVSGSRITVGDYLLSSTQITIPDGGMQGTATFTIHDDSIFEGPETAKLTIFNASAGITIGPNDSENISITDNETLDQAIDDVLNQTTARQTQGLQAQLSKTFPASGMWFHTNFALAAYGLNQQTADADAGLITAYTDGLYDTDVANGGFHWRAYLLERVYFLYASQSEFPALQGRMSTAAENAVLEMLWDWAAPLTDIGMASPEKLNFYWGSENHDAQAWVSLWGAAQIFKDHPNYQNRIYADGSTPAAMAAAFDDYFKAYVRNYTVKGLPIEVASPTYAKYTLNTWYNLFDFAEDPELKEAAGALLDVYWADWALEQIDGVRGGSRHRSYPGSASISGSGGAEHAWYSLGQGVEASKHPGVMSAATTFWRPSRAVVGLALDVQGRGSYGYTSRRLGLKDLSPPPEPPALPPHNYNAVDPDGGSLLRYTWSTPDFVMGMSQVEARHHADWTGISGQNRWNGVIFGGHDTARIFTQRPKPSTGSVYNAEWGVQHKGAMILHRLSQASGATGQMIWFDFSLNREETNGWIFAEAPDAFAAVRVVHGGWTWQPDTLAQHHSGNDLTVGEWAVLNDQFSPIIMEVARKQDYADIDAFKAEILSNPLAWDGTRLDYNSTEYDTTLTLFADESEPPQVDSVPLNFSPVQAYDSPYLQGDFGGGTVVINYGDDRTIHGVAPLANDTNTVALWHFDEALSDATGTYYADDVYATARISIDARERPESANSISVIADGKFGDAVRFDFEAGDQYMITTSSKWPVDEGTFRFQGWIRLNPGDTGGYLVHVYDQVYLSVSESTATFAVNKSGVATDTSPANRVSISADISTSNQWQYIDAMYDGASITLLTEVETVTAAGNGSFVPNVRNIYLGSRKNSSNFVGEMDEVKLSAPDASPVDYGDAPSTYPVTQADNGAVHAVVGPRLGRTRDSEVNGQPTTSADGDGNDEDGVMFGSIGVNAGMAAVNVDLQNAAVAKVDAWIDFDGNGEWEPSEQILTGADVVGGMQTLNFAVPATAVAGNTFARVRVSTVGGLQPTGFAPDGEVEDYQVTIFPAVPQVESVVIGDGIDPSRSKVTSLTVTFDSEVDHASLDTAFTVTNITTSTQVGSVHVSATDTGGKTTAVLTFSGASTLAASVGTLGTTLVDGNYELDILASGVQLATNNAATMPIDHIFGGQLKAASNNDNFFRWYGDDNGDGFTDFTDFASGFLPAFGSENGVGTNYNESLDANRDGFVDFTDFASGFLPKFGTARP